MKQLRLFFLFIFCASGLPSVAQLHYPFGDEIRDFKKQDSIHPPQQGAILFVGSSSFRKWTNVQEDFPGYKIINRGFGGSTLPDVIHYAGDIIFPYHPKQIVIYCGDNDAASSDRITADSIFNRFVQLYRLIRRRLSGTTITYLSIKPSPSRERLMPVMDKANWEIRSFLAKQPKTAFVDVYHLMLDDHGLPRKDIFGEDMLHMNAEGYAIWQKALKPYLKR